MLIVDPRPREVSEPVRTPQKRLDPSWKIGARAAAAFCLLFLIIKICQAALSPPWVDEVFTSWMVGHVPANHLWQAVASGADCEPPTYYLLLKRICDIFGTSLFAMRLPSVAGFLVFQISLFLLLRRRLPAHICAAAMALPCLTQAGECATWARPYAIVAGCFGLAALVWDAQGRRIWHALGIASALGAAMLMHFYSVLLLPLIGAMEILWWNRHRHVQRSPRWERWLGMLAGGLPALMWLPLLAPLRRLHAQYAAAPMYFGSVSLTALGNDLCNMIWTRQMCLITVLLVGFALLLRDRSDATSAHFRDLSIVAAGFLLLPVITFLFAELVTKTLFDRYLFITTGVVSLAAGWTLIQLRASRRACIAVVAAATIMAASVSLRGSVAQDARVQILASANEPIPILVAEGNDFFELIQSAPDNVKPRLAFMSAPSGTVRRDPTLERTAATWKQINPSLPFFSAEAFLRDHPRFYLVCRDSIRGVVTNWLITHDRMRVVQYQDGILLLLKG